MVDPEVVRQIHSLVAFGWGARRIGREVGVARGTVRRYLRGAGAEETQRRPSRRKLDEAASGAGASPRRGFPLVTGRRLEPHGGYLRVPLLLPVRLQDSLHDADVHVDAPGRALAVELFETTASSRSWLTLQKASPQRSIR